MTTDTLQPWRSDDKCLAGWQRPGHGPIVHFLHGNGFCSRTLWPMAQQLPASWHLIFTDIPGHGRSPQPDHRMPDWQAMAESIARQIETMSNGRAVMAVGHSMGGVLSLLMAARYPSLFASVDMLDPVLFTPEVVWAQRLMRKSGFWKRTRLVRSVASRRRHWADKEQMQASLRRKSLYRQWNDEALQAFVCHGSRPVADGVELACDPAWEASIFGSYPRGLWSAVHRLTVPTRIWVAGGSYFFIEKAAQKAARRQQISWFSFGDGHCFPMEAPELTGEKLHQLLCADSVVKPLSNTVG
ncbi:alpha/beta fold hydrolase [Bacterioplanes sanyensis]|uniref:alpha/beta fold hydrolase n=1 Tax=Bacterioplanes sanyensis TaxID=1249553 RepID=UPI00167B4A84|nr:alpha/beta hydrolase [Bacterioplanes sanyensis]